MCFTNNFLVSLLIITLLAYKKEINIKQNFIINFLIYFNNLQSIYFLNISYSSLVSLHINLKTPPPSINCAA